MTLPCYYLSIFHDVVFVHIALWWHMVIILLLSIVWVGFYVTCINYRAITAGEQSWEIWWNLQNNKCTVRFLIAENCSVLQSCSHSSVGTSVQRKTPLPGVWASAGRLDHVYIPTCTDSSTFDWMTRYLHWLASQLTEWVHLMKWLVWLWGKKNI